MAPRNQGVEFPYHWVVPGRPHPLQRARGGQGHHYDTADNERAKEVVRRFARWPHEPYRGPVEVRIHCCYVRPHPTADVDNLAKTVLDAMNRYIIWDDSQVMLLTVSKIGGQPVDETVIHFTEWGIPE